MAAAHFSSRGYAVTTLEEIGADLGMTRAALYYYAKSKEDLLFQCYQWTYERFRRRLDREIGAGTGRERLSQFFGVYSEIICDDAARCFLSTDTHQLSRAIQKQAASRVRSITTTVADLLDEGMADGSLAVADKKVAITILFGAFNHLPELVRPGSPTAPQVGAAMMQMLLDGLASQHVVTPKGRAKT